MKQRILIVDDSALTRQLFSDWVNQEPDMEAVGIATNGKEALDLAIALRPDVITLDVEMPVMNGIQTLYALMQEAPTKVIMVSSLTSRGTQTAIKALELGAIDILGKPHGIAGISLFEVKEEFLHKIRISRHAKLRPPVSVSKITSYSHIDPNNLVLVAGSTGGPQAITCLFRSLPRDFPAAMLVVQHMPPSFTASFAKRLDSFKRIPCREAKAGDPIIPGVALLAPGGKHMVVGSDRHIMLTEDPPLHGVRPAADPLFKSAAQVYGHQCIGIILSGMGKDGTEGSVAIRQAGGITFGESKDTCTIYGMPLAAKIAGGIDAEYPIGKIGEALVKSLEKRGLRAYGS